MEHFEGARRKIKIKTSIFCKARKINYHPDRYEYRHVTEILSNVNSITEQLRSFVQGLSRSAFSFISQPFNTEKRRKNKTSHPCGFGHADIHRISIILGRTLCLRRYVQEKILQSKFDDKIYDKNYRDRPKRRDKWKFILVYCLDSFFRPDSQYAIGTIRNFSCLQKE